ncbi:unnamed protein product [Adineta steineri]|uniref:Uncharacterized protein n=1 Tax=Adineta steineri TaxID=433720 RepID=A0A814TNJ9_9BILA|nr:unnamed protein product [Adineta steineri]CAF1269742.1 unnamed protein product [Adineta steineri]
MLIKLLKYYSLSLVVSVKRSATIQSGVNLSYQMELLNDNKQFKKALELFEDHTKNSTKTFSSSIITQALKACTHLGDLERGKTIHQLISSRTKDDFYITTSLIHLYMQCYDLASAELLFDTTAKKKLSIYGAMMKGYIKNKQAKKAIDLFNQIDKPDEITINLFFNACAQLGTPEALNLVNQVSNKIPKLFYSNSILIASLLDALMKCGDVKHAELLFDKSKIRVLSMYGAMMKGYIKNNKAKKAIDLFDQIKNPNEVVFILLFNACAQLRTLEALNLVKQISSEIPKSFHSNSSLITSLLDALMKCGDVQHAESLFDKSKIKVPSMYGAMMKGYIQNNKAKKAIDLFSQIKNPNDIIINLLFNACAQLGTPEALNLVNRVSNTIQKLFHSNSILITSLLDALMKCGDVKHAKSLFDKTTNKILPMYGAMMNGFNLENNPEETLNLFNKMKVDNIEGSIVVFLCVIKALSQIGDYSLCQSIIKQIPNSFFVNTEIQYALIDMWGKSGHVDLAKEIFEKLSQPNQVEYTNMINGYGLNGMGIRAIELYYKMPKEFLDDAIYVCILNACSHSGLVQEARSIFESIEMKTEKVYGVMIDCLSRASLFDEAEKVIDEYEYDHSPSSSMYMAVLSGARNIKNAGLSQKTYDHMKKLFSQSTNPLTSAAVLLANTYASSGDIEKASNIRNELHKSGQKKKMGLTSTVVNGEFYVSLQLQ